MKPIVLVSALWFASRLSAAATIVSISSVHDTSIYSDSGINNANGGGVSFIVGTNGSAESRRGLLRFDLSSIPANAVIEGVSLSLTLTKAPSGDSARLVSLHRALASWGENSASDAGSGSGSGSGVAAQPGDATWLTRFFDQGPAWTTAGGDFIATASATTSVTTELTDFAWSGAGMLADVQAWVASPSDNFGWIVRGDESTSRTNRQFFTHESTIPDTAPTLTVTYSVPEPHTAMFLAMGGVLVALFLFSIRRRLHVRPDA
ncbi:MAG: DNRLRE domain-containing protein [Terrimicrobiaceae bacterium]|nr:DNRLRE domain-containing protein [Terrimicrobiaceae bacterium]